MPTDFKSTNHICDCEDNKQRKSFGQQILVWDKFNGTVWLLLVFSFVVWCIAYFAAYEPAEKKADGGMDHDMPPMGPMGPMGLMN